MTNQLFKAAILEILRARQGTERPFTLGIALSVPYRNLCYTTRQEQQAFQELVTEGLIQEHPIADSASRYTLVREQGEGEL